ncbi:hypothetical protein FQZ97_1033810 [compost metagenome]
MRRADGFLGTVVEVIAEGRPYLALELDGSNQLALVHDQDVPELGRPEITGKRQGSLLLVNLRVGKAVLPDDLCNEVGEAVHIFAAGDTGALALIRFAGFLLLLLGVFPALPESLYSLGGFLFVVSEVQRHS